MPSAAAVKNMEAPLATSFQSAFKITNTTMLINGCHPSIERNIKWMLHYLLGLILICGMSVCLFYSIFQSVKSGDIREACRYGILIIVDFVISFKYLILLLHQADTMRMVRAMERDYVRASSLSRAERSIVRRYAERGAAVCRLWFAVGFGTISIFPIKAVCLMLYYAAERRFQKVMVFEMILPWYDERKYDTGLYVFLSVVTILYGAYAASIYTAFDPVVPIFMLHCCGQLELAMMQIRQLFPEDGTHDPAAVRVQLGRIIEHLQSIYSFADTARRNFAIVYEMVLKANTVLIPITLFQIIESFKLNTFPLEFISFGFGCLVHYYVPCYYSDLLMDKSVSVTEALYSCGWERETDLSVRRTLAYMILRAQKPLAMTTAFQNMCLDSFTEMCRQSYAIFNLMNAS